MGYVYVLLGVGGVSSIFNVIIFNEDVVCRGVWVLFMVRLSSIGWLISVLWVVLLDFMVSVNFNEDFLCWSVCVEYLFD